MTEKESAEAAKPAGDKPMIMLVDDDEKLRRVLSLRLDAEGFEVVTADSAESALAMLERKHPRLILADLRMPGLNGIELTERVQIERPGIPVVMLTAHGDIPDAVAATKAGAVEFLTKPVDRDELVECLRRHLGSDEDGSDNPDWAEGLVYRGSVMQALIGDVGRVAKTDTSVLIRGESGTGKELIARAIHRGSKRHRGEFVALNCGAVPAELLESELFGHKKGAFTGAHSDHPGLFRIADGGTIFLDEIGDMPNDLQVKLLRVLQEREVRGVGETRAVKVDVRVISATHRNLQDLVKEGGFREDLYYRLNVVQLQVPRLSERREDIPVLVAHCLNELVRKGLPRRVYAPEAMELLVGAPWPGNVRELFNVIEQNVALSAGRVISVGQVRRALGEEEAEKAIPSFDEARDEFTRNYLGQLLELAEGNVSRAARLADRNRTDFYKLLKRHDIDPKAYKD